MPSSNPDFIAVVLKHIQGVKPQSVLDVGVGYGKWGFLLREYLEAWNDRVHPSSWKVLLDGVEVWEPYTKLPWIKEIYNTVHQMDIRSWPPKPYDVVICGDVIEHLPKQDALKVLKTLLKYTRKRLVLSIPIGDEWLNNVVVDGNPHEKHKSSWTVDEIYELGPVAESASVASASRPIHLVIYEGQWREPASQGPIIETQRNTILHVHNVQWIGGTGNFVYDFASCFPEFNHTALCVNSPKADPDWLNWVSHKVRPMYAPVLTPEIVEEIDPKIVVLHNTAGKSIHGDWKLSWLKDRFVIAIHHNPTQPLLRADVDVFVSEHIKRCYAGILDRMTDHRVIPPCTDLNQFAQINGGVGNPYRLTAAGKGKLVPADLEIHPGPNKRGMNIMPGYLKDYDVAVIWSGSKESWCRTVTECMAAGLLVVAHNSGAIPEQVKDGQTGFLFDDEASLRELLPKVLQRPPHDLLSICTQARRWALSEVGFQRMRAEYYPLLMQGVLR